MRFTGKIAVVTGAARGIGLSVARALATEGASVFLADRNAVDGATACADLVGVSKAQARFSELDVTDAASWGRLRDDVKLHAGQLDILVNCAGRITMTPIAETPWETVRREIDINLGGAYLGTQAFAPLLANRPVDAPWASIVNVSSMAATSGAPFFSAYAASKAALSSFTKSAALEFARFQQPIRVNAVLPGTIDTDMTRQVQQDSLRVGGSPEEARAQAIARHPMGRLGDVDHVANAVLYLADARTSFTTGLNLLVGGGREAL